jgi:hypothetical protein
VAIFDPVVRQQAFCLSEPILKRSPFVTPMRGVLLGAAVLLAQTAVIHEKAAVAAEPPANTWRKVAEGQVGPRSRSALVHLPGGGFTVLDGYISHAYKGDRPYDVQAFEPATATWKNGLPEAAKDRGKDVGPASDPGFKTPYFAIGDKAGVARLNPQRARFDNQFAFAPWDGSVYALVCGHTVKYDPKTRIWVDLAPKTSPVAVASSYHDTLCWGALCADPVNREIVLVGGCGAAEPPASPGTWVYSPAANTWRKLDLKTEPSPRAHAPMAYDPASKSIVLFGGDRLNALGADTWVYDCAARAWAERKPVVCPAPRFGHALLTLPSGKGVLLVGGKTYTSSTSYCAMLYAPLPFEMWLYDVAKDSWSRLSVEGEPPQPPNTAMMAAVGPGDEVLVLCEAREKRPDQTWVCRIDPTKVDPEGAKKTGVKPGTLVHRTGPYDPDWYTRDVPPADPAAFAKFLADLPANNFVEVNAPKWPTNRMVGGWSTVALDPGGDQLLHLGGGHSAYFGSDVAHFDLKTGRWSVSGRPEFALDFNYDLSGPGAVTFGGSPWGNHNYKSYGYDPLSKRLLMIRKTVAVYDPVTRTWPAAERFPSAGFLPTKYESFLCPTPKGVYLWGLLPAGGGTKAGLFKLTPERKWEAVASGPAVPVPAVDRGSAIVYDSSRDRFIITSDFGKKKEDPTGRLWAVERESGKVTELNPAGRDRLDAPRFAREAVYLPKADLVLFGALVKSGEKLLVPFYDPKRNEWLLADVPGSEVLNGGRKQAGAHVDLGLVYDAKRDLVFAVLCELKPGAVRALRIDAATLKREPGR